MTPVEFKIDKRYPLRLVACRIAMCLGVGGPLAFDEHDQGYPHWHEDEQKFDCKGNDWWLRKLRDNGDGTYTVSLDYRYETEERRKAMEGLAALLSSDIGLGPK